MGQSIALKRNINKESITTATTPIYSACYYVTRVLSIFLIFVFFVVVKPLFKHFFFAHYCNFQQLFLEPEWALSQ